MATRTKKQSQRLFTHYEKNQLRRFQISETKAREYGQMPVEYITGHVNFCGLDFLVNQNVLIPRVETEELVEFGFELLRSSLSSSLTHQQLTATPLHILDLGTGSGAIAISLAQKLNQISANYQITASDISRAALALAKKNAQRLLDHSDRLGEKQLNFIYSNLLDQLPTKPTFNLIIANLPYIPTARIKQLDHSVKDFEPHLALDGGQDGLELISRFLDQAGPYLNHQGLILMEIDYTHPQLLRQRFAQSYQIKTWTSQLSKATFAQLKLK